MKDGFLQSRGIAYRINDFRDGRPTLVFIHGLSGSASAWWKFEEELTEYYNLVTYDLRGHGLSKKYTKYQDYEIKEFAEDLAQLISHLQLTSYSLVAHSFGALIAYNFLTTRRASAASAIFLSTNYKTNELWRTRAFLPFLILATSFLRLLPFSPHKGSRINYRSFTYSPDWSFKRVYPEIKDMTVRLYLYCLRHIYLYKNSSWDKIDMPVLLMHGRADSFVPVSYAIRAQKDIRGSRLIVVERANHMLVINNVSEIVRATKEFIK